MEYQKDKEEDEEIDEDGYKEEHDYEDYDISQCYRSREFKF